MKPFFVVVFSFLALPVAALSDTPVAPPSPLSVTSTPAAPAIAVPPLTTPGIAVQAAGRDMTLSPPDGECAYDRANPTDARVIEMLDQGMADTNQLLMAFGSCKDIETLHRDGHSTATDIYGQVLFPLSARDSLDISREQLVALLAEGYKNHMGNFENGIHSAQERLQSVTNGRLKVNGSQMLGVIQDSPDIIQLGVLQTVQTSERAVAIIGVVTSTKAGLPININLYKISNGADNEAILRDLSNRGKTYARQLIAMNPETAPAHVENALPHADARPQESSYALLTGALLGAFVVVTMGAIFLLIQKRRRA